MKVNSEEPLSQRAATSMDDMSGDTSGELAPRQGNVLMLR